MMKKRIPIGIEFYKEMIDENYYYVDKTMMIKEVLDGRAKVSLFTRPRRFGKTLVLNMIKTFFEDERDRQGARIDNRHYFDGKKIAACGEEYMGKMGQYPVISLSLKSAKQPDFETAYKVLREQISYEFERHSYLLRSDALEEGWREKYRLLMDMKAGQAEYATALGFLSGCLKKYHGNGTVILLDEYDVPLENAYYNGFYDEMVAFVRSLFESSLKTNESLEFAVITGCLRISRESIFTGLNNLKIVSILRNDCAEYFGFTPNEAEQILADYGMSECQEEMRRWYDGYLFGDTEVYNPWSVINYIDENRRKTMTTPRPYWSNTSSNSIIRDLVERSDDEARREIEGLIAGGTIEKQVHEDITYGDIYESQENLWNFLFFTGYLKKVREQKKGDAIYLEMMIPNTEVRLIYDNTILAWFHKKVRALDLSDLYRKLVEGDVSGFEGLLKKYLRESISFMDSAENFYHGFLLGLLQGMNGYERLSNREAGEGRYDILLKPYDEQQPAMILELKCVRRFTDMEGKCLEALRQIEEKHYDAEMVDEGYPLIKKYGICFCKKSCMVREGGCRGTAATGRIG